MGTLPYMAPEQVEGKPADARTDLRELGLILYEMLTGGRAFEASSPTSLVGAILEREPPPLAEQQPLGLRRSHRMRVDIRKLDSPLMGSGSLSSSGGRTTTSGSTTCRAGRSAR
jgi:serine/threonine protein kinase